MKHLQELAHNEKRWKIYQIKVTNIGSCEWYIDAIISYISIHYGILNFEINFSKQEMVNKLKNIPFSSKWLFSYSSENRNIIWNKNKLNKLTNADKKIILKEYSKINDLENRKKFLVFRNMNLKKL